MTAPMLDDPKRPPAKPTAAPRTPQAIEAALDSAYGPSRAAGSSVDRVLDEAYGHESAVAPAAAPEGSALRGMIHAPLRGLLPGFDEALGMVQGLGDSAGLAIRGEPVDVLGQIKYEIARHHHDTDAAGRAAPTLQSGLETVGAAAPILATAGAGSAPALGGYATRLLNAARGPGGKRLATAGLEAARLASYGPHGYAMHLLYNALRDGISSRQ